MLSDALATRMIANRQAACYSRYQSSVAYFAPVILAAAALPQVATAQSADRQGAPPSVAEIEKAAIAARRAVTSGHVTLNIEGANAETPFKIKRELYFDERYIREETTLKGSGSTNTTGSDAAERSIIIIGPDRHYRYSDKVFPDGSTYVLSIDDRHDSLRPIWDESPDPRLLGMSPLHSNMAISGHLDWFVGGTERKNIELSRGDLDGYQCNIVSFQKADVGCSARVWIAPELGSNVVRMTAEFDADGVHYVDDCRTTLSQDARTGNWFPSQTRYQRSEGGKVTVEETVDVEVDWLNRPIPAHLLEISSMGVPPHTPATFMYEHRGRFEWDGDEVAAIGWAGSAVRRATSSPSGTWALVAVNLIVAALGLLYWALRRGR